LNSLKRFLACVSFKKVNNVFFHEFSIRKATLEHWYKEGLPNDVYVEDFFGFDRFWSGIPVNFEPIPPYDTVVLEEKDRYVILQDGKGATVKYFKVHDTGFDTRQWLDFRVKTQEDFEELKTRLNPKSPKRYPPGWRSYARLIKYRDAPYMIGVPGQFWFARDYIGLFNLLKFFYVKPNLIHEMMNYCVDFVIETIHPLLDEAEVDAVTIAEDMSYKTGPMIGPFTFKEFMFDNYKRLAGFFKDHGVKVIFWDTDGNPDPILSLMVKAGINGFVPIEAAAEVNPVEIGRKFPELVLRGGIDKRVLAMGTEGEIKEEIMKKVPTLIRRGGYLPTVDHAVAPETPLRNYIFYLKILKSLGVGPENLRDKL